MKHGIAIILLTLLVLAHAPASGETVTLCGSDRQGGDGRNLADAIRAGGVVTFDCKGAATIQMTETHPIGNSVTIDGKSQVTLQGGGDQPMFAVQRPNAVLVLKDLLVRDTKAPIVKSSPVGSLSVTIIGSTFTNCTAPFGGGPMSIKTSTFRNTIGSAINADEDLTLEHTRFEGGRALNGVRSPAVVTVGQRTTITDSVFIGNPGGGLVAGASSAGTFDHTLEIVRGTFDMNGGDTTGTSGNILGAVTLLCSTSARNCTASIINTNFLSNQSDNGAALLVTGAKLVSLKNVRFEGNTATGEGGAIFLDSKSAPEPKFELEHTIFKTNRASVGAAIRVLTSSLQARAVAFFKNEASEIGGAISAEEAGVRIARGVFVDNVAGQGGSAVSLSGGTGSIFANTLMARNRSQSGGTFAGSDANFINSTIADNTGVGIQLASGAGGNAPIILRNTIVSANTSGNCQPSGAGFVDDRHNIEFPTNTCGTNINVAKPQLDTLYLPILGSPARSTGDNDTCLRNPVSAIDVYGKRRPLGSSCSIGAAEGDIEKEVADRTVGAPAWTGGLDAGIGPSPGGAQAPAKPPAASSQCCCCFRCALSCGR